MNNRLWIIIVSLLAVVTMAAALRIGINRSLSPAPVTTTPARHYQNLLMVGSQTLHVDIATSTQDMAQGLSDRLSMADNQGMLFNFESSQLPTFWMKDMNFPLDFLWISQGKIVGITPDAPGAPKDAQGNFDDSHLPVYAPPSPVDEVLEVNAGWAQKNNITIGDAVK